MKRLAVAFIAAILISIILIVHENGSTISLETFHEVKVFDQIHLVLVKSDKNRATISRDDREEVNIANNN